jgi:hypothetical protein
MTEYTVLLFRSGRVWIGDKNMGISDTETPLLIATVEANSEISAMGKLLLEYVDKAQQPYQHIPICVEPCCTCQCGLSVDQHTQTMSPPHIFTPHRP